MRLRTCGALMFLLCACATTEPSPKDQWAIPLAPTFAPAPMLSPPVPIILAPEGSLQQEPQVYPAPENQGSNRGPPAPVATERRNPECEPVPVPHAGEDDPHNECADKFPPNRYPGMDVLVGGKHFDALQVGVRVLWEIKTHQFDTYSLFLRNQVLTDQVEEFLEERRIALTCGYGFVVGVSSAAHHEALIDLEPSLAPNIVVTGCKR